MGKLYVTTETGEVFELGEVGSIEITPEPRCDKYEKIIPVVGRAEKTFEFSAKIGKRYRRIWLRTLGIGKGTNNWFKVRGGTMDRDHQMNNALKLIRRRYI